MKEVGTARVPKVNTIIWGFIYILSACVIFRWQQPIITRNSPTLRQSQCQHHPKRFFHDFEFNATAQSTSLRSSLLSIHDTSLTWKGCVHIDTVVCGVLTAHERLLDSQNPTKCIAAMSFLLLTTAIDVLDDNGHVAVPIGSTLRHLWEYQALPPNQLNTEMLMDARHAPDVKSWFWTKGFHHFQQEDGTYVTCMAQHHPLSTLLASPNLQNATTASVPHIHWTIVEKVDENAVYVVPSPGHSYRRRHLVPLTCLTLHDEVTIEAPQNPSAFFEAVAQTDAYVLPTYPSQDCEAFCNQDIPIDKSEWVKPNVVKCPYSRDVEYENRLSLFKAKKIPLQLSSAHQSVLESPDLSDPSAWRYCLPIKPQQCGASRGIKSTLFETPSSRPCRSAVLHVLLENILEVTNELNLPAFPYFGTLLGAWRDEGIIPHTRDIDVIFPSNTDWDRVKELMWQRGFYVFDDYIRRACFASHHPLAPLLYSESSTLVDDGGHGHGTPYLDLYQWQEVGNNITIQTAKDSIPKHHVFPLSCQEEIFGMPVPTIAYPEAMFHSEYGTAYANDPDLQLVDCESYCDYQLLKNNTSLTN